MSDVRRLLGRPAVLVAALAAIVAAMIWWMQATADGRVGASAAVHAPVGTELVLSLLTVLRIEGPNAYVVGNATLAIPVTGPTAGIAVGQEVTIGGIVGDDRRIEARWLEHAPDRRAKKRLGMLGLAVAAAIGAASVRPTRRGLEIRGGAR